MKVIEFIKDKKVSLKQNNAERRANWEAKYRDLGTVLNNKFTNTLNNPWMSRFNLFEDSTPETIVTLSPAVEKMQKQLELQLGEENYVGEWRCIDQHCINQFAEVTGDRQWIHTDPERAQAESPFKTTIAHGFLTLSLIPSLTDSVTPQNNPYPEAKMVVNYGLNQVRFPYPVKAGCRVRARSRIVAITPMKRSIEVVQEVSIEVENSRRPACIAETVLRLYF